MIVRLSSSVAVVAVSLAMLGCEEATVSGAGAPTEVVAGNPAPAPTSEASTTAPSAEAAPPAAAAPVALTPVPLADGKVSLTPDNTSLGFVGTHVGPKPDPRIGGFGKFAGTAEVDAAAKTLKSATVDIQVDSLFTQMPPLTNHLKSPDFFDAREKPTAKFVTTSIAADASKPGTSVITGDLTLHGVTKPVSFPAKIEVSDAGLTIDGSFTLDRSQFGMDKLQERVEKNVTVTVAVGKKTTPPPAGGGFGGPGGGRRGPGGPGGGPGGPGGPPPTPKS